jgi:hypothetical protein
MASIPIFHFAGLKVSSFLVSDVLNLVSTCQMISGMKWMRSFGKQNRFELISVSQYLQRHLNMLIIMKDGHFGLQRFAKVDDLDDVSLLPGAGFFPDDDEFSKYIKFAADLPVEVNYFPYPSF